MLLSVLGFEAIEDRIRCSTYVLLLRLAISRYTYSALPLVHIHTTRSLHRFRCFARLGLRSVHANGGPLCGKQFLPDLVNLKCT